MKERRERRATREMSIQWHGAEASAGRTEDAGREVGVPVPPIELVLVDVVDACARRRRGKTMEGGTRPTSCTFWHPLFQHSQKRAGRSPWKLYISGWGH